MIDHTFNTNGFNEYPLSRNAILRPWLVTLKNLACRQGVIEDLNSKTTANPLKKKSIKVFNRLTRPSQPSPGLQMLA